MNLKEMYEAALKAARGIAETAKAQDRALTGEEIKSIEEHLAEADSLKAKIEQAQKGDELIAQLNSMGEIKSPQSGELTGTLGERFVKSQGFQEFKAAHPSGLGNGTPVRVEAKDIGGLDELGIGRKATITTQTGQIGPQREPGYYNYLPPDEPLTFLDLITTGNTDVPYSEYAQIVAETNNAAVVAEGELKPLSDVTTKLQESKAYTYADGFDITNQTLADDGALAAFMESRIKQHVLGVVEQKLLNGAGAGTEPQGIMTTTGTLAQAFDADAITTLARALETFETANGDADPQAIVMNPSDIWSLRLLKDSQGRYMFGDPLQQGPIPTPWGVPIVKGRKLAKGTALVGRFDSVNFLQLEALNVLAFNQHKDYAQRNMVYVRAEMRGRQLFYAPREVVVATIAGA